MYTKEQLVSLIKNEDMWPRWPLLPMKRRKTNHDGVGVGLGAFPETAVIISGDLTTIIHAGLYENIAELHDARRTFYASIEAMLDDGWVVD